MIGKLDSRVNIVIGGSATVMSVALEAHLVRVVNAGTLYLVNSHPSSDTITRPVFPMIGLLS